MLDPTTKTSISLPTLDAALIVFNVEDLTSELFNILKSKRDEFVLKMKLTSKDEFEVLSKRVENLENKINKLEKKKK